MVAGERGKFDARYFWLTRTRSTLLRAEKLVSDVFGIAILLTFAAVLPLLAVHVIVFAFFDLERGYL
jgi:hypothetical protein